MGAKAGEDPAKEAERELPDLQGRSRRKAVPATPGGKGTMSSDSAIEKPGQKRPKVTGRETWTLWYVSGKRW